MKIKNINHPESVFSMFSSNWVSWAHDWSVIFCVPISFLGKSLFQGVDLFWFSWIILQLAPHLPYLDIFDSGLHFLIRPLFLFHIILMVRWESLCFLETRVIEPLGSFVSWDKDSSSSKIPSLFFREVYHFVSSRSLSKLMTFIFFGQMDWRDIWFVLDLRLSLVCCSRNVVDKRSAVLKDNLVQ